MNESFAFAEVVRKLANLIRIGKISQVDGEKVRVSIGPVVTNWLPIVSVAGNTTVWTPITVGEQVVVFAPYGEMAQGFVLRAIHYADCPAPSDKNAIYLNTKNGIKVVCDESGNCSFNKGLKFSVGEILVELKEGQLTLSAGSSKIEVSSEGVNLACGASCINISENNILINSGSITTNPPVCRCSGGI